MTRKNIKAYLIAALFLVSLGGLIIHYRAHHPSEASFGYVPLVAGLISVIVIPTMFMFRPTLHLAHLLNGFTAIIGIITMAHFSFVHAPLYAHLAIVTAKFYIGRAIFELAIYSNLDTKPSALGWRTLRYPNMGFWYVHLVVMSAVYALGHFVWK